MRWQFKMIPLECFYSRFNGEVTMPEPIRVTKQNWRKELNEADVFYFAKQILIGFCNAHFENAEVEPFMRDDEWRAFIDAVGEFIFVNGEKRKFIRKNMRLALEPTATIRRGRWTQSRLEHFQSAFLFIPCHFDRVSPDACGTKEWRNRLVDVTPKGSLHFAPAPVEMTKESGGRNDKVMTKWCRDDEKLTKTDWVYENRE